MKTFLSRLSVAALTLLLPFGAIAATQHSLRHSNATQAFHNQLLAEGLVREVTNAKPGAQFAATLARALDLGSASSVKLESSQLNKQTGLRETKYTQIYKDVPLWANRIHVSQTKDGNVKWFHGNSVTDISEDVKSVKPGFAWDKALSIAKSHSASLHGFKAESPSYRKQSSKLVIWLDGNHKAHLVYVVTYLAYRSSSELPLRPVYIIDAHSGAVLKHWNGLETAQQVGTGPGGNPKIGRIAYGQQRPKLFITQSGGQCSLRSDKVVTQNMHGSQNGTGTTITFNCSNNPGISVNQGYGIDNDAHYDGREIVLMYRQWYNVEALPITLKMRVNIGPVDNAFWDGSEMNFGNGQTTFYPLSSGLNVGGHEVSHGFTQYHSNLQYQGQSGGINESFSDMAGETLEQYVKGSVDWHVGADIDKQGNGLRSMSNPPSDGSSIDNAQNYRNGMNVHFSSGVFNKAFYLLATHSGWTVRKAFDVFVEANEHYWSPNSGFQDAGQGAVDAAAALGYNSCDVSDVMQQVGVQTTHGSCGGGGTVTALQNGQPVTVSGNQGSDKYYKLDVPSNASDLTFQISGGSGNADLYVKFGAKPDTSDYDCRSANAGNSDSCSISNIQAGTWYVLLHGSQSYSNVSLEGSFNTGGPTPPPGDSCDGVPAWNATSVYTNGDQVSYQGKLYTANWWNRGDNPADNSGPYQEWTSNGDCSGGNQPPPGGGVTTLQNGAPVTASGDQGSDSFYKLDVPSNASDLSFQISGGSGNADLYVKLGSKPGTSDYDCHSANAGNDESCSIGNVQTGTYYVLLHGTGSYSNVSLEGAYSTGGPTPPPGDGCTAWAVGNTYQAGDIVSYEGNTYTAQVTHTAYSQDWNPVSAPALWNAGGNCD